MTLYCSSGCFDSLAIQILRVWEHKAISIGREPQPFSSNIFPVASTPEMLASVTGEGSWLSQNHAGERFIIQEGADLTNPLLVLKLSDSDELFTFKSVVLISEQNDQNDLGVHFK